MSDSFCRRVWVQAEAGSPRHEFWAPPSFRVSATSILGVGSYGVVCAAVDEKTKQPVAIKKISPLDHPLLVARALREVSLLRRLRHPNLMSAMACFRPQHALNAAYVVMPRADADLASLIHAKPPRLDADHGRLIAAQVLRALRHLHGVGVVHRDVKPSNVLVNADCSARLCDYGLAVATGSAVVQGTKWVTYKAQSDITTLQYRAPEVLNWSPAKPREYTAAIDIWGVGCILAEILAGKLIFSGNTPAEVIGCVDRMWAARRKSSRMGGSHGEALADWLTTKDPSSRPTAARALGHPYFANLKPFSRQSLTVSRENFVMKLRGEDSKLLDIATLRKQLRSELSAGWAAACRGTDDGKEEGCHRRMESNDSNRRKSGDVYSAKTRKASSGTETADPNKCADMREINKALGSIRFF